MCSELCSKLMHHGYFGYIDQDSAVIRTFEVLCEELGINLQEKFPVALLAYVLLVAQSKMTVVVTVRLRGPRRARAHYRHALRCFAHLALLMRHRRAPFARGSPPPAAARARSVAGRCPTRRRSSSKTSLR